jgi:transposase
LRGPSHGTSPRGSRSHRLIDVARILRPYVKAHKNDDRDAEAIAEAATRPTMRFVDLKSEEQLDMQTTAATACDVALIFANESR